MPLNGEYGAWSGPLKPSTEWRFHLDIMRARPDVGAIVHSHPPYCTTLAALNRPILAAHYMIAYFGGSVIECARYAPLAPRSSRTSRWPGSARGARCCSATTARSSVGPDLDICDAADAAARAAGAHLLSRDLRRPAGDPGRRGDRPHRRALQDLRRRRRRRRRRWPRPRSARAASGAAAATKRGGKKKTTHKKTTHKKATRARAR